MKKPDNFGLESFEDLYHKLRAKYAVYGTSTGYILDNGAVCKVIKVDQVVDCETFTQLICALEDGSTLHTENGCIFASKDGASFFERCFSDFIESKEKAEA